MKAISGKLAEQIRLGSVTNESPKHFLNTIIFDEGKFGAATLYFATWHGDILRVKP